MVKDLLNSVQNVVRISKQFETIQKGTNILLNVLKWFEIIHFDKIDNKRDMNSAPSSGKLSEES